MNVRPPFPDPVLLYDGECGLCNRVVRGLLRLDTDARLRYTPLQSAPAQAFLRQRGLPTADFDTLVFVTDWAHRADAPYLERSTGALAALRTTGRLGTALATLLALIPAGGRDAMYRFIGHTRYRWFGPWKPRPLPRAEWAARFLR